VAWAGDGPQPATLRVAIRCPDYVVTDDPRIGVVLDHRYRLVERLGAGGMGVVYKAGHCYTGELVAVKLLHADAGGARTEGEIRMRFGQEPHLQVLARHANVVRVIDAGVDGSQPYLVSEYVDGEDLQRRLDARGALPVAETLAILQGVAAALDAAHQRGIVHRDVKPANVLVRSDGAVLLTDFGVAKDPAGGGGTAVFVGTTVYASPEQITLTSAVDWRSDVYSLGCVMFHCLVGHPPFEAGSLYELMNKHLVQAPPAVSEERPGLPPALDGVIARALAKSRDDRFSTCADLIAEGALAAGIDLSNDDLRRSATPAVSAGLPAAGPTNRPSTYPYATEALALREGTAFDRACEQSTQPSGGMPRAPGAPRGRRRRAAALVVIALVTLLAGLLAAYMVARTSSHTTAGGTQTTTRTRTGTRSVTRDATKNAGTSASGFTGYAAQLANDFPGQVSAQDCGVEPDGADPGALVQIRCRGDSGRVDAYYELWPSEDGMNHLLDANGDGLNVYFAGTWTDTNGTTHGRIDRFFTGLLDPQDVILWSYSTLNATIWAQSTLSPDELLAWWRTTALRAASPQRA
jgi:eukaryotic-like serine/threonine-protein kinase